MGDYGCAMRRVTSRLARRCHPRVSTGVKKTCSVFVRQRAVERQPQFAGGLRPGMRYPGCETTKTRMRRVMLVMCE